MDVLLVIGGFVLTKVVCLRLCSKIQISRCESADKLRCTFHEQSVLLSPLYCSSDSVFLL